MKSSYKVGEQTRQNIFEAGRKLFYQQGFTATTYNDICTATGMNRALIPYHFNSKQSLGYAVYSLICQDFHQAFNKAVEPEHSDSDLMYLLRCFAYYKLFSNKKLLRFASELIASETPNDADSAFGKGFLPGIESRLSLLSEKEQDTLLKLDSGMEKEIIKMLSHSPKNWQSFVQTELRMMMSYSGYTQKKTEELLAIAAELSAQLEVSIKSGFLVHIHWKNN